jgi:uncharacterized Tic20 family protein
MTSYGAQPTPQRPQSGPASPASPSSARFTLPDRSPGQGEGSAPGHGWPAGPHEPWHTAEDEPWPDWPTGPWPGGERDQGGPGEPPQDEPADREPGSDQPSPARAAVRAGQQWSAQLRRQAPAQQNRLNEQPAGPDERWAMISYLGVPFLAFLPALAVYLIKFRTSRFARQHATQALNLSITVILYNVCAVILGGLLALDSVAAALVIMVPLLAALWLVTLAYLVLAGTAASRGDYYRIPGWLCATLVR